jgi:hypothetical protein
LPRDGRSSGLLLNAPAIGHSGCVRRKDHSIPGLEPREDGRHVALAFTEDQPAQSSRGVFPDNECAGKLTALDNGALRKHDLRRVALYKGRMNDGERSGPEPMTGIVDQELDAKARSGWFARRHDPFDYALDRLSADLYRQALSRTEPGRQIGA